ncbi:MAG: IMPACT family protein [Campylobacteraceae bacterium]|jgi:uncharacterized YigZ family protein|nr:IMPACT family protein [Campylobacteraceae bacterium]
MRTIANSYFAQYEVKKSVFIAHLSPMSEFESVREKLKAQHPKAAHIVWAYRYLNEFDQIVENGSDDGEPKGTSAQPILNVLRGLELVNAAVLIVRYFGGVKLGTGGLVRAYGTAAKSVLGEAELLVYLAKELFCFSCKYTFVQRAEYVLNKLGVAFEDRSFEAEEVAWRVLVTQEQKEELLRFLEEITLR